MAFPTVAASTDGNAQAAFQSACSAAGLQLNALSGVGQLQLCLANLLDYDPTTSDVPAGNVVPGTFAANTASPTGAFTFAGVVAIQGATLTTSAAGAAFALDRSALANSSLANLLWRARGGAPLAGATDCRNGR